MLKRLEFQRLRDILGIEGDAFVVLTNEKTGAVRIIPGRNIVTDEGDKFYAQCACGETPTETFVNLYLATAGPATPAKDDDYSDFTLHAGSEKAPTATYPKTNDGDSDNTGAGVDVISWKYEYTTSDGPFVDVTHSFISRASASGTDPVLNSYKWAAAWSKDSATSAKIFANHTVNGT
jgi:hypothetical protein